MAIHRWSARFAACGLSCALCTPVCAQTQEAPQTVVINWPMSTDFALIGKTSSLRFGYGEGASALVDTWNTPAPGEELK